MALSFDATYYLSQRPDVFNAFVATNGSTGLTWAQFAERHYNTFGRFEGSNPNSTFNTLEYLRANPDVAAAGVNPFTHYLNFGINEGRAPSASFPSFASFDSATYLAANTDLASAGITTKAQAYAHFVRYGQFEGRPGAPVVDTGVPGVTKDFTTGVDNLVGTSNNDTFNATNTTANSVLGGLDKVDGGAGVDTVNIADTATAANADFSLPAGISISNIETMSFTTNGALGTAGGTAFDVSGYSGLTKFNGTAAGAGTAAGSNVKAAGTTDVSLTVSAGNSAAVSGGKAVTITAATGSATVTGNALTTVTVNGSNGATIDNVGTDAAATTAKGTTMTAVTLNKVDGASALKGEGLATVTVTGATANANTITVTNAKADHSVTLNVDGTGYKTDGTAALTTFVDSNAKTITVNATGSKSNVALTGSTATTTVNITGSADLTLDALASATKIDGSKATGGLTLGTLNAATVNVSTGSGKDSLTLSATAKAVVDTGAGNDTVTLASVVAAGSTISLGAGDDKVLVNGGSVATSTATAVTVIDGGDGVDSISASLINAANAGQFKNFEKLDISATATLDAQLMTGSTLTGLTLSGDGGNNSTVTNVAAGVGLEISGTNSGSHSVGVLNAASGTADTFAVTFAGTAAAGATAAAPTSITGGTLVVAGIETLNIASSGTGFVSNSLAVTDSALQTLNITGDKAFGLTFAGTNGTAVTGVTDAVNGVKLIDGSTATGALNVNTTGGTINLANAGLTIKTGSGNDTITLGQKAVVDAGAGNDSIVAHANGGTFTGGLGNDVFNISATGVAIGGGVTEANGVVKTTIVDFGAGDKIKFDATASAFTATKVALDASVTNLDAALALASNNAVAGQITWFQYANNTYIVENADGTTGIDAATAGDIVVKLTGIIDLSNSTFAAASQELSFA